jgi:electron transfer flavoprotein beta subunit
MSNKEGRRMKVLTLIRQVPDAESSLRTANYVIDLSQTELVMDTMDEYGVEQALRLREASAAPGTGAAAGAASIAEVIALAVGPHRNEKALRNALALGADRAIHVETQLSLDPIALSKVIAKVATNEGIDLIFCGGRQADWDSEALGGAVAERLNWPQLTWTTQLELAGDMLSGRHDTDDGSEAFSVPLPAVVTTQQGLNEPRYPTLPNIMKARKKELRTEPLDSYQTSPMTRIEKTELQARARLRNIVRAGDDPTSAVATLADVLRKEAKVHA